MTASNLSSADRRSHGDPPSDAFYVQQDGSLVRESARTSVGQSGRLDYIDALRGGAAIQVLLSHAMLAFFPGIALASPLSRTLLGYIAATPLFFVIDGASAVCIFFVLSGYVLTPIFTRSPAPSAVLIFSRFARLGIPALAGCALSAVLFQVLGGDNHAASIIAKSQWLATGWQPSGELWFVKDALVNGLLLGFRNASVAQWFGLPSSALTPMSDSYLSPLWTLSIEFYGSIFVLILARTRSWLLLIALSAVMSRTYFLCFFIGHVAARHQLGGKQAVLPWPLAAAFSVFAVFVCMGSHFWDLSITRRFCEIPPRILPPCPTATPINLMRLYGATFFTVAVMQCAPLRSFLGHERLRNLGRLSFPIYLTHWPIIFGVGSFLLIALAPWIGPEAARFLALAASIALTALVATYFARIDQFALDLSRILRKRKTALVDE